MANKNPTLDALRRRASQRLVAADRRQRVDQISAAFLGSTRPFHEPNDEGGSKGLDALKKVRDDIRRLRPHLRRPYAKQLEIEDNRPENNLTDEEVELLYQDQLAKLRGPAASRPRCRSWLAASELAHAAGDTESMREKLRLLRDADPPPIVRCSAPFSRWMRCPATPIPTASLT